MRWLRKIFSGRNGMSSPDVALENDSPSLKKEHLSAASYDRFYKRLLQKVEDKAGANFDPDTLTGIIGFSTGGPISVRTIKNKRIYVTCELARYREQQQSADGLLHYELMTEGHFPEDIAHRLLTAIGGMSLNTALGKKHTIDVTAVIEGEGTSTVVLDLYSRFSFEKASYGIYRISPLNPLSTAFPTQNALFFFVK
ncbi:hypothetical protein ACLBWS_03765 [Brucellaceae bacterium D45D]